ncbi:hypothetical protein H5410_055350 [Solanum commersonii]|uniref:Gag-pol polyprotein n=1 Tax=Solanum commersonii TaxID=4109 RepID=A0A9J5WJL9_SOLCO|nr:hypothetical protein H5410_055350 [Solanum commersonii]
MLFMKKICEPFCVSSPVGESILAERVYRDCVISINHKDTMTDLVKLDLVDFDVILGMDWLHACYALVDCRTRVVKFQFPNERVLKWKISSATGGMIIHLVFGNLREISMSQVIHLDNESNYMESR